MFDALMDLLGGIPDEDGTQVGKVVREETLDDIVDPSGRRWRFVWDPASGCRESSPHTHVLRGRLVQAGGASVGAYAKVFESGNVAEFAHEYAVLTMLSSVGVGPTPLAVVERPVRRISHSGAPLPILIEEDAGITLSNLLGPRRLPGDTTLARLGTQRREIENAKILFDLFSQVKNAHDAGYYHCDLTSSNVCIRRFGDGPADLKATVIDFNIANARGAGMPHNEKGLFRRLFTDFAILPCQEGGCGAKAEPSPLEADLCFLAALWYELERDSSDLEIADSIDEARNFLRFVREKVPFVKYADRRIDRFDLVTDRDMRPLAERAELVQATPTSLAACERLGLQTLSHRYPPAADRFAELLSELALGKFHRTYLDREDLGDLCETSEMVFFGAVDDMLEKNYAQYYEAHVPQGDDDDRSKLAKSFEDQPDKDKKSGFDSVLFRLEQIKALGFVLVPSATLDKAMLEYGGRAEIVHELSEQQVDLIAELEHNRWMQVNEKGWHYGKVKNEVTRENPLYKPWSDMTDEDKRYDMPKARGLVDALSDAGLALLRLM